MAAPLPVLTAADLTPDREVRWCPGCGDFAVLDQLKKALAAAGAGRHRLAVVGGGGCAGRLPFYLRLFGVHAAGARPVAVATGLVLADPDLQVWVVTGDGDALGAGGGPLLHALRRNVDLRLVVLNNQVHGRSRGQCSPATRPGTTTATTPFGSADPPLGPLAVALAAGATFAARGVDTDVPHLAGVFRRAAAHRGAAVVEVYQNCAVFNDGAWAHATDHGVKADGVLYLADGRPLAFGKDRTKGLRLTGLRLEVVDLGRDPDAALVHDEAADDPALAMLLARLTYPDFPEPLGVLRAVRRPTLGDRLAAAHADARAQPGPATLDELFREEGRGLRP